MDIQTLAAAVAVSSKIPGSAAKRAETAASAAESAAELARQYGYRIRVEGKTLIIGEEGE